ncbi:MAG TPA: penicillin-binding transpeptidase domain-containing protein [Solirubrobacteraceae bacterium]
MSLNPLQPGASRRRRAPRRRGLVLAAALMVAGAAVAVLVLVLAGGSPSAATLAERYARAWARRDWPALHADLSLASPGEPSLARVVAIERRDEELSTASSASVGRPSAEVDGRVSVPVSVRTRDFRTLYEQFELTIAPGGGDAVIRWNAAAEFPGLRAAERLRRVESAPSRGILLARDGTPLNEIPSAANLIGDVGAATAAQRQTLIADGFPASTPVGVDGLEQLFQRRLAGRPGGVLYGGRRLLAATAPRRGADVRTSVSPALQSQAVTELGTSLGGIAAMDPATGEILAAAGRPLSELQPPGSTFKIITLTGVLEAGLGTAHTVYPYASSSVIDGFTLHNSDGESCGGTLANAFAVSCNSVFAPLGVRLGATRMLAAAQSYGFNAPSPISIAAESSIPPDSLDGDLALGDSAIGQGQVLASPLQMLRVAATIALVGRRPVPTFAIVAPQRFQRVIPVTVARTVRALMRDVVAYGTGTAAQIPGVIVAGKTGTAQVITPQCNTGATGASGASGATGATGATGCPTFDNDPYDTDAWFVAFAPEIRPRIVVAVLLPNDGAGGTSAAPLAKPLIETALGDG